MDKCLVECERELSQEDNNGRISSFSSEKAGLILERYFILLEEEGIDYPDSEFNRRAISSLIRLNQLQELKDLNWKSLSLIERARSILNLNHRLNVRLPEQKDRTQLDAIITYLEQVTQREGYEKPRKLWLPILKSVLPLDDVLSLEDSETGMTGSEVFDGEKWPFMPRKWKLHATIGIYDDPANQLQAGLSINFTDFGNIAVCGLQGSGRSTALQTILYSFARKYSPQYLGIYVLDFSSRMLACFGQDPHCGGVLCEDDIEIVSIFFNMLNTELKRRRELLRGGNYYQYVMKNGVDMPAIIVAIDNYGGFREKTICAYDELIMHMLKECNTCGIHFLLSASGFSKDEIPYRLSDSIHYTLTLEMIDRFAYADALRVIHVPFMPESGIPGRGLASVSGEILEFQMCVAVVADDDYQRGYILEGHFLKWTDAWTGDTIRKIPRIPSEPLWNLFADTREVIEMAKEGTHLPVGYMEKTAGIYGIDLRTTYTWLVEGNSKIERRNMLQILAKSAALRGGLITILEPEGNQWRSFADSENFEYLSGFKDFKVFFEATFAPTFVSRNKIKRECLEKNFTEEEIYQRMSQEPTRYLLITDLFQFTRMFSGEDSYVIERQMINLLDKGFLHNIYIFSGLDPDDRVSILENNIFRTFTAPKAGIYLGKKIIDQRIFDFSSMSFNEQNYPIKQGRGVTAPTETEDWHRLVLPICFRQTGFTKDRL